MLAKTGKLADTLAEGSSFILEPKLDGLRCIAVYENGKLRLYNRQLNNITDRFPEVAVRPAARNAVLDGELICLDDNGLPSFQRIQTRANRLTDIAKAVDTYKTSSMNFDLIFLNDVSLAKYSYTDRRRLLLEILPAHLVIPQLTIADIKPNVGEGVMLKDTRSGYSPGIRSPAWRKVKWEQECIVVVQHKIPGLGKRKSTFGALRISDLEGNDLGKVGGGFTDEDFMALAGNIQGLRIIVRYNDKTNDGKLRFPRFISIA